MDGERSKQQLTMAVKRRRPRAISGGDTMPRALSTVHAMILFLSVFCIHGSAGNSNLPHHKELPEILREKVGYKRWRTITERRIRMAHGHVADFDLVGLAGASSAVLVFAFSTKTKTATLVREYHPGPHAFLYGVAAGIVEDDKHNGSPRLAAQHELEEECHLSGGTWHELTPCPLAMDKYTTTKVRAYLVLDAEHVEEPKPLDDEENIEIIRGVTIPEILEKIYRGEMNLVGTCACLLAMQKLKELNAI